MGLKRTQSSLILTCVIGGLAAAGCEGMQGRGAGGGQLFRNPFRPPGVEWTVMCMEFRGTDRRSYCARIAEALRNSPGIRSREVFTIHERDRSRLYYGHYWRTVDENTGKYTDSPQMEADVKLIKDLTIDGGRFFLESRVMPAPTPDVGNPDWEISRNPGIYTLRIALFYAEPGFSQRKKAAADLCEELREMGHEAWYRHGDFTSEVFVGSFGDDALKTVRKSGVLADVPGPPVVKMQRNELFRYELHNGKKIQSGDRRYGRASRVVPVRDPYNDDMMDWPW